MPASTWGWWKQAVARCLRGSPKTSPSRGIGASFRTRRSIGAIAVCRNLIAAAGNFPSRAARCPAGAATCTSSCTSAGTAATTTTGPTTAARVGLSTTCCPIFRSSRIRRTTPIRWRARVVRCGSRASNDTIRTRSRKPSSMPAWNWGLKERRISTVRGWRVPDGTTSTSRTASGTATRTPTSIRRWTGSSPSPNTNGPWS